MVTVLTLLGVLAVLFAAAVLATREQGLLAEVAPDDAALPLPAEPLTADDVGRLRFSLAARGYRMSQVDEALDRLAGELADRDRRIALLEAGAQPAPVPVPPPPAAVEQVPEPPAPVAAVVPEPVEAPSVPPPPSAGPTAWSSPSSVPEFPVISAPEQADPLPPADLGTELVAEERAEERAGEPVEDADHRQ